MLLLLMTLCLLPFIGTSVPIVETPLVKHPSIDALNSFSQEFSVMTQEVKQYSGRNQPLLEKILKHSQEVLKMLHAAGDTFNQPGNIDFPASAAGFTSSGDKAVTQTHIFADVIESKVRIFRAEKNILLVYGMLDQHYAEASFYVRSMKKKLPAWLIQVLKPMHNELLGTIAEAREAYRPTEEEINGVRMPSSGNPYVVQGKLIRST